MFMKKDLENVAQNHIELSQMHIGESINKKYSFVKRIMKITTA